MLPLSFDAPLAPAEPDALLTLHILPVGNGRAVWPVFAPHHYLTSAYHGHKALLAVLDDGTPVAFASSMSFPHKYIKHGRREHRTVVLPDFQGLGVGIRLSEFLGDWHIAQGHRFYSRTSHPRMAMYREASPLWRRTSKPGAVQSLPGKSSSTSWVPDQKRFTYAHEYLGRHAE